MGQTFQLFWNNRPFNLFIHLCNQFLYVRLLSSQNNTEFLASACLVSLSPYLISLEYIEVQVVLRPVAACPVMLVSSSLTHERPVCGLELTFSFNLQLKTVQGNSKTIFPFWNIGSSTCTNKIQNKSLLPMHIFIMCNNIHFFFEKWQDHVPPFGRRNKQN